MTYSFEAPTDLIPDDSRPLPRRTPRQVKQRRFLRRWHSDLTRAPFSIRLSRMASKVLGESGTTRLTARQWERRCMWDAVGLNCIVFGVLILSILWSGECGQSIAGMR